MNDQVKIIMVDGREFEVPRKSLPEYRFTHGEKIARIVNISGQVEAPPSVEPEQDVIPHPEAETPIVNPEGAPTDRAYVSESYETVKLSGKEKAPKEALYIGTLEDCLDWAAENEPISGSDVEGIDDDDTDVGNDTESNQDIESTDSDSDDGETDKSYPQGTPNKTWRKADLQAYLDNNHADVTYQANDTKEMLLNFIKAAKK